MNRRGLGYRRGFGNRGGPRPGLERKNSNFASVHHSELHSSDTNITQNDDNENRYKREGRNKGPRQIGFNELLDISKKDPSEIVLLLSNSSPFFTCLESDSMKQDWFILIMDILPKIGRSAFSESKAQLLIKICNTKFLNNLLLYIIGLPYASKNDKFKNSLYWKDINTFWVNFIQFCDDLINIVPTFACEKLAKIQDSALNCIQNLEKLQNVVISEDVLLQFENLQIKLALCIEEREKANQIITEKSKEEVEDPFGDFRELSVIPTADDLLSNPKIRPIIEKGSYISINHYLDIQFRLLREDFLSPLRDGINDYLGTFPEKENRKRKQNSSTRFYQNVHFMWPRLVNQQVGIQVDFEAGYRNAVGERIKSKFARMKWERSKRFMFGSLILFTQDHFKNIIFGRVLDRDIKQLQKGYLVVSIEEGSESCNINYKSFYTMVESEVYFEPYYHVLKALKDPRLVVNFPFADYVIKVQTAVNHPCYLNESIQYTFDTEIGQLKSSNVLDLQTWPSAQTLGLNESQYEALQSALLREFAVIQGPPGTGKTFVGLKIAEILLKNLSLINTPMLVVCYTNHALDQFLEGILKFSDHIVRIGGQSKSDVMDQYNLKNLRSKYKVDGRNYHALREARSDLQREMENIKTLNDNLNLLTSKNCIIGFKSLVIYIPALNEFFKKYHKDKRDPVLSWLLECMNVQTDEPNINNVLLNTIARRPDEAQAENEEDVLDEHFRNDFVLDDIELSEVYCDTKMHPSYSLKEENNEILCIHEKLTAPFIPRNQQVELQEVLCQKLAVFDYISTHFSTFSSASAVVPADLAADVLTGPQRWSLYFLWVNQISNRMSEDIKKLEVNYKKLSSVYEEFKMMYDREFLKNFQVIGITTTGAARQQLLLNSLASPIVIIEEAAEVLESHIVVSLTEYCQHLILIGDHKQLRPSTSVYRLGKVLKLELSLFERMVKNGLHCSTLQVQHRMRPEIARLISPHIYTDLQDHPSVTCYPNVRGITKSLFFLSHNVPEEKIDDESSTRKNYHEADFIIKLARYVIQQGYEPQDVTILTTYTGQMFYLMDKRKDYPILKNVRITVVDNFQGEESKIILLSLVRSNAEANVGFLKTENRVCVALSRAKEGLFIIGNMSNLVSKSDLWVNINGTLEDLGSIGTEMTLVCENHGDMFTKVSKSEHFDPIPEGGCTKMCLGNLSCGHQCASICHVTDRSHSEYRCKESCTKILCKRNHDCPLMCWMECQPCTKQVNKTLPCGHDQMALCHQKRKDVKCQTQIQVTLEACGHEAKKRCSQSTESVICTYNCEDRLKCGHACVLRCHKKTDPDHILYRCTKDCQLFKRNCSMDHKCNLKCFEECKDCVIEVFKTRTSCNHKEKVMCHIDLNTRPCMKKCKRTIPKCGHHCQLKCSDPCGGCRVMVEKTLKCGHKGMRECGKDELVQHTIPCQELVDHIFKSACGHKFPIPCHLARSSLVPSEDEMLSYCTSKCNTDLQCGHTCAGNCNSCYQGRIHLPCKDNCGRTLICGHICNSPCNQACPPCKQKCNIKCDHNKCTKFCGEICFTCKEKCTWSCAHLSCKNTCGEDCSRQTCNEKCPNKLKCNHPCRGACGEPCPQACFTCDPDNFPRDFVNEPYADDVILVQLADCGHMLDIDEFDQYMNTVNDDGEVYLKSCPLCKTPILNTRRGMAFLKNFMIDINKAKVRMYGVEEEINEERKLLLENVKELQAQHVGKACMEWRMVINRVEDKLKPIVKNRKRPISQAQLNSLQYVIEVLTFMANDFTEVCNQATVSKLINNQIRFVSSFLQQNLNAVSQQMHEDIDREMQRSTAICQYMAIKTTERYKECRQDPTVTNVENEAKMCIFAYAPFDDARVKKLLRKLADDVKSILTESDRKIIYRAMGLAKGHWYKCPNGHVYAIGECGQAMETSTCPDCKMQIGGGRHALLPTNVPVMDIGF